MPDTPRPFLAAVVLLTCAFSTAQSRAGERLLASFEPAAPTTAGSGAKARLRFVDATAEAGIDHEHRFDGEISLAAVASAGVAAGDLDGDGLIDLIAVRADAGPPLVLRNQGDGTFAVAIAAGLEDVQASAIGPTLGDFTGDGRLDLVFGALRSAQPRLFVGRPGGTFVESASSGAVISRKNTFSSALGDFDRDGDLDLALGHWDRECLDGCGGDHLWENLGGGRFGVAGAELQLPGYEEDFSFTLNFADVNDDGWPDLLVAADLITSRVFINDQGKRFVDATDPEVITDRYGMGSAVGDYDNDGDLDWFVTSNQAPDDPNDGNRLYRNRGGGVFEDVTRRTRVGRGGWGWAACFADFDNDGWLDIFNVNGWFDRTDRSKLFMAQSNGRFRESARRFGLNDQGDGRGVVCFDYDRDGDIDIFTSNHGEPPRLFRNDGGNEGNFLNVRLLNQGANPNGVGARIYVTAGGITQMRELRCGSNYLSQDPTEAHFGLGDQERIQKVEVVWPDGSAQTLRRVVANQFLTIERE